MRAKLLVALLSTGLLAAVGGSAAAGPGGWVISRQDDNYHFVEQWSDYLTDGNPATTLATGPHAVNPTVHQWTFDDEVTNTYTNGTLVPGASVSFDETYLSDGVERVNQALAFDRQGNPLQVTVAVANQYHSRSSTESGETCVVGPAYPHMEWWDHTNPYGAFVVGSNVTEHALVDDGGWAVDPTTVTVTVTNTGSHTAREVQIWSLIGRPYIWGPPLRPAACDGLPVTPAVGNEPQWRS